MDKVSFNQWVDLSAQNKIYLPQGQWSKITCRAFENRNKISRDLESVALGHVHIQRERIFFRRAYLELTVAESKTHMSFSQFINFQDVKELLWSTPRGRV